MNTRDEVLRMLRQLHEKGLAHVVLRRFGFIGAPDRAVTHDVDVLVPAACQAALRALFAAEGYYPAFTPRHLIFARRDGEPAATFDFHLGQATDKNLGHLSYDEAAPAAVSLDGIPVLGGTSLLLHLVVHSVLGKGRFVEEDRAILTSACAAGAPPPDLSTRLEACFGRRTARHIAASLECGDYQALEHRTYRYMLRFLARNPGQVRHFLDYGRFRARRRYPRGAVVSLIGLDGTGKTTLARALVGLLARRGFRSTYLYMGRKRDHALPMHALSKKIGVSKLERGNRTPRKAYLLLRECAYYLDLLLRYLLFILPNTVRGTTVVCDRYAYEFFLDTYCGRLGRFLLSRLYPRPDVLVFLELPEAEIVRRKNEYDSATRAALLARWEEVADRFRAVRVTSDDLAGNSEFVFELVIRRLACGTADPAVPHGPTGGDRPEAMPR